MPVLREAASQYRAAGKNPRACDPVIPFTPRATAAAWSFVLLHLSGHFCTIVVQTTEYFPSPHDNT